MADHEQDRPAAPRADPHAGAEAATPGRPTSVWADLVISGADDDEPEPAGPVSPQPGDEDGGGEDGPRWPSSGLPASFGQQAGVRPGGAAPGPAQAWAPPQQPPQQPADPQPPPVLPAPAEPAFERPQIQVMDEWPPVPPAAGAGYPGPPPWPQAGPDGLSADQLTADLLLPGRHAVASSGWRKALYQMSGGLVRVPQSAAEQRRQELIVRARTPVAGGHHRVAVLSLKGGVGKTTTTMGLGSMLASLRGDRVIAVDANPDRGTLCDKLRLETSATVRDLLSERDQIHRYADVRAYTTQAPSRLEVLASDRDPTVSVAFSAEDYQDVARVLEHYYSICVTDCGTGLLHSAMAGVLGLAGQIVLVSSPSVDGARSASATLDWLAAHNYGDLVRSAVVVLSAVRPHGKTSIDIGRLEQHFAARCRAVVRIPYDPHLEEGAEVDLAQLNRGTADAYLVLAAEVGDGFSWSGRARRH